MSTKPLTLLTIVLLTGLLAFVYFHKDSGHDQAMQRERVEAEMRYRHSIDSARKAFDEMVTHKDSAAYQAFKTAQESANKWEGEAVTWKRRFNEAKHSNRTFNDSATTALLGAIR